MGPGGMNDPENAWTLFAAQGMRVVASLEGTTIVQYLDDRAEYLAAEAAKYADAMMKEWLVRQNWSVPYVPE